MIRLDMTPGFARLKRALRGDMIRYLMANFLPKKKPNNLDLGIAFHT
jgi:hypothetical protein